MAPTAAPAIAGDGDRVDSARVLDHGFGRRRPSCGHQRHRRASGQRQAARRRDPVAGQQPKVPGRGDSYGQERLEGRGETAQQLAGTCPPATVEIGTWCLDTAPYPLTNAQAGKNNYLFASKACEAEGGWLPSASELLGAADRVKLESTIHDSPLTATVDQDPSRGLKDEREMSSTLVTTEAGSAAAGFEGVSEGATGNPRQGQPNPQPLPANPLPESLQYVTVYDNANNGGFAGSEPVADPENFRCAFAKAPGALNKSES